MNRKLSTLLAVTLLMATHYAAAAGEDETGPVFVKVFAGESPASWNRFRKLVRRNLKRKETLPDTTEIPCEIGKYYALGVIASDPGKHFLSFETTAIFRDLDNYNAARRSHREHTLTRDEYGTRRFSFKIRSGSVDHDMTLVVHIGKQVYVRHKFEIRGCEATTSETAD